MPDKQKIAVLGGGLGAMAAVYALTHPDNPKRNDYDITVYQLGWRLGGKGASGRNPEYGQRIEEHGLHIWFGCYENAFQVMRHCYAELDRPANKPLARWNQAFTRHGLISTQENIEDTWKRWDIYFPENSDEPGNGDIMPSLWAMLENLFGWLVQAFGTVGNQKRPWIIRVLIGLWRLIWHADWGIEEFDMRDLFTAKRHVHKLDEHPEKANSKVEHKIEKFLLRVKQRVAKQVARGKVTNKDEARRFLILLDLSVTCAVGLLRDGVLSGRTKFSDLDRFEFKEWLAMHGAEDETLHSSVLRGYYDLAFAYQGGVPGYDNMNISAGATVYAVMRMFLTYRGSLMWKMQGGMGDVVFGPFYEVLKKRGVTFKFFHKVENLGLNQAGDAVETIKMAKQVDVKNDEYDPLVDVKGLPCWPSEPIFAQLVQGEQLKESGENLENFWSPWQNVGELELKKGEDFDQVLLAIPVKSHPYIASELMNASAKYKAMVENISTTPTQAMQLWLKDDTPELGWPDAQIPGIPKGERVVLDAFAQPFNTWADLSNLLDKEAWPSGFEPKSLAYLCGPLQQQELPPTPDTGYAANLKQQVKANAIDWLNQNANVLWPKAYKDGYFDWDKLVDIKNREGQARFDGQYYRANMDPSEQYTQSLKNTTRFRLKPGESGFENLTLAGDWTFNGLNLGAVEPSVVSGLLASRAVSGYPAEIEGVPDI